MNCNVEQRAKVKAFYEGLEPTEVECPVKKHCSGNCLFVREGHGEMLVSDEVKLFALRQEIKSLMIKQNEY